MELNHRPHAYQACALTGLSYRPPGKNGFNWFDFPEKLGVDQKPKLDLSKLNSGAGRVFPLERR